MKSYLTNRKQCVVFNCCQSEQTEICTGVVRIDIRIDIRTFVLQYLD